VYDPLVLGDVLAAELVERRCSGYEVVDLEAAVADAVAGGSVADQERLLGELERRPRRTGWPYVEPSDLPAILDQLPASDPGDLPRLRDDELRDRLAGAWLGRCAGCNLGKPVEGWSRERIDRYLRAAEAFPIDDYLPRLDPFPDGLALNDCWTETTRGNITSMARDDDTDYTIVGLHTLEEHGVGFTAADVGDEWRHHLPIDLTYTAERAAYRNLVHGLRPPETAVVRNPYREWIGAQIRADAWGYVSPGDPAEAARMAFHDASLSHTGNGIYGEMWVAALLAICLVPGPDPRGALSASVAYLPERSRLAEALRHVLELHELGYLWQEARDEIEISYGHYNGVHTINNAAVVAAALLWGAGDFSRTIGLAVEGGWDTDCNGATAGSVFGAIYGAGALPAHWVSPLHDRISSAIVGFDGSRISDLVDRTFAVARDHGRVGQGSATTPA
jgi:ADP-ribosylglycohydrolase